MAALSRLASSNHRQVEVLAGDTVIIAATPIPGNERNVARIVDNLISIESQSDIWIRNLQACMYPVMPVRKSSS